MSTEIAENRINRAILYSEPGTTKTHIEEIEVGTPGPGEVLIRMFVISFPYFLRNVSININ
jgi:hypothetical protein